MKTCIVFGDQSDIFKEMRPLLTDYEIVGWNRNRSDLMWKSTEWDLVICTIGSVAPVGRWENHSHLEWMEAIHTNMLLPIKMLKEVWENRKKDSAVCFFAGANPNRAGINYSGYYTGKMALLKAIENIDAESEDCKLFALAPGIVFTKIHEPTYVSGIRNDGLEERRKVGGTPIKKIYEVLVWCLSQPKSVVGGRNICVSDIKPTLEYDLADNPSMFKLRRVE